MLHDDEQPMPCSFACVTAARRGHEYVYGDGTGPDPRLACWLCGEESAALAPRQSGGDEDVPAHWVPVCADHLKHWAQGDLPIIERTP